MVDMARINHPPGAVQSSRLLKNSFFNSLRRGTGRYRHFQTRYAFENEARQKPRFLPCGLKKAMDGLFQRPN
jgi:hypothetical protein